MTILSTFTNLILHIKQKTDVKNIAIYDQADNNEVFQNVKYIDGSVSDDLKVMEHPKEDGTNVADHVIDDAKSATVKILIEDDDSRSLNEILEYYKKRTPLTIKIKNEIYGNFIMSSKPLKADVDHYNTTVYDLTFKEVLQAQTQYVKMSVPQVKQPKNASTVNTGQKQAIAQTQAQKKVSPSILRKGLDWVTKKR